MTGATGAATRIGLVLGAGGVVGGAFHAGVLAALEESTGWDPRTAPVIVGTSAGSVTAAGLRAGLGAADLLARAEERPLSPEGTRLLARVDAAVRPPALRRARGASRSGAEVAATLREAARRPFTTRPLAILASLVPDGTVPTEWITAGLAAFVADAWPAAPLWICAVRQRDGRRIVFGRDAFPPVPLAVAASCAIPRVFRPVAVDADTYVDGGAHSPTNADLLAGADLGLDLVLVSSPMSIAGRRLRVGVDQPVRGWARALLEAEAVRIRSRGSPVMAFQPGPEDLATMGLNAMDPGRRRAVAAQARESTLRRLARADTRRRLRPLLGPA